MNLNFESFNNSFLGNIDILKDECKNAFKIKEIQSLDQYSTGNTYFVKASEKSHLNILERLALEIFQYHTRNISYDPSNSGAEWWVQCIHFEDEIGFHFDKDYGLEENSIHKYPNLATVSYLSSIGASTVIIDKKGPMDVGTKSNKRKKITTNDCLGNASYIISKPVEGKHIKFDGRLLHGAPTKSSGDSDCNSSDIDSNEDSSESNEEVDLLSPKRITFLVNIWIDHIPVQAAKFSGDKPDSSNNNNNVSFSPIEGNLKTHKLNDNYGCEYQKHKFRLNNDLLEIGYNVPNENDLKLIETNFDVIHVPTNAYCCVKKIGEFVGVDESDDDDQVCKKYNKL